MTRLRRVTVVDVAIMVGALLAGLVAALVVLEIVFDGPEVGDAQAECRDTARVVFEAVMSEPPSMSEGDGQAMLDEHCEALTATDRAIIVDDERSAAIARYLATRQ